MSSILESEIFAERSFSSWRVRPMVECDFDAVFQLAQRAGVAAPPARAFFDLPWNEESISSLVHEDDRGRIRGSLGVMARPMRFHGRLIQAAVAHHLVIERSIHGARAAVELARHFINGPQDLSLASGNDACRRIWSSVGGSVSNMHSVSWMRTLRPARYALRTLPAGVAATLTPACRAIDATLRLFNKAVPPGNDGALSDELDAVTMYACVSSFAGDRALQPVYDVRSLSWILETLEASRDRGTLHRVAVRTLSGRPLGWYLYYLATCGIAEVLQLGGTAETVGEILQHLFVHASQRGALSVTGPMDARLCGVLSEKGCMFQRPPNGWMLFHSRDRRIADAIQGGDAFLTRLESDWWTRA